MIKNMIRQRQKNVGRVCFVWSLVGGGKKAEERVSVVYTFLLFYEHISNILFLDMNAPDPSLAVRIDSDTKK